MLSWVTPSFHIQLYHDHLESSKCWFTVVGWLPRKQTLRCSLACRMFIKGVPLGSTAAKRKRRKQDQTEGEVGLDVGWVKALDNSVGNSGAQVAFLSYHWLELRGWTFLSPGGTLIGFRLPLEGCMVLGQAVFPSQGSQFSKRAYSGRLSWQSISRNQENYSFIPKGGSVARHCTDNTILNGQ